MSFQSRLKEARLAKGYTQEQLATQIGVAKSTYTGYEKGNREPNIFTVSKIVDTLDIDANFLWQDDLNDAGGIPFRLNYEEIELIEKYRKLDGRGRQMVNSALNQAYDSRPVIAEGQLSIIPVDGYLQIWRNGRWENYQKWEDAYPEVNAAHARTDIDVPEGTDTSDDDIMDDENF